MRPSVGQNALAFRDSRLTPIRSGTLFLEPASPGENGYVESFDGEPLLSPVEANHVVDRWRLDHNHYRSNSILGSLTPVQITAGRRGHYRPCIPEDAAWPGPTEHTVQVVT